MRLITIACASANSFAYEVQDDCVLAFARVDSQAYLTTDPEFDSANYPTESGSTENILVMPLTVQLTSVGRQLSKGEKIFLIPEAQPGTAICQLYLSTADNP